MKKTKMITGRTCLICKQQKEKNDLFRLIKQEDNNYVYDAEKKIQSRGSYVCISHDCLNMLAKNKRIKVSTDDLLKMLNLIKKERKDYFNILSAMKNSRTLAFGMNMILEDIENVFFLVIATDINEKNDNKLIRKATERNIPYIHYSTKNKLGEIFGKDEVSVIAVKDKNAVKGLIN